MDNEIKVFDRGKDLIRCNLCKREMLYDKYEKHYDKCLEIKTLLPLMREEGIKINYKDLDEYEISSLDKILEKYISEIKKISNDKKD